MQTANMITSLYPKGPDRVTAAAAYAVILLYINTNHQADARTLMFRLLDVTLKQYTAGKLIGGYSDATRNLLLQFETGMYCTVGVSTSGLVLPGDPSNGGTVNKVVFPSTAPQNVVTPNGNAGVQIPPNSFTGPAVVVTITPLTGTPLNTKLDQYGPFSDVKVTPEPALGSDVSVGICPSAATVPLTVYLAHNVITTVNNLPTPGIEVLPRGAFISGLCGITTPPAPTALRTAFKLGTNGDFASATKVLGSALGDMLLPTNANATGGGITGTTKKFSPFGGVDTKVFMTTNSVTPQSAPAGSAVASPPSALVKTLLGALLPSVSVQFTVTSGGGTISPTTAVTTDATGVASLSSWVINAGPNTVQAVGTYADPTVTFAAAPAGSGFPQVVTVDPTSGVTYSATGGDVIPYGASYQYSIVAHDLLPGFQETTYVPDGWTTGRAAFGAVGSTSCPIFTDTNFPLRTPWGVDTDLLLRTTFSLPSGWNQPLVISAAIDNDVIMYVNGKPLTFDGDTRLYAFVNNGNYSFDSPTGFVKHENCATKDELSFTVPASFLLPGQNLLAVRARDRGGVNYLDLKVSVPSQ